MSDEILINRVFSGYDVNLKLGYEAINLIKADKETKQHYIYAMPDGVYSKEHFGKIKAVLIVRGIDNNRLEVLAKATNLEYVLEKEVKEIEDDQNNQKIKNSYKVGHKQFKDEEENRQESENKKIFNVLLNEKQNGIIENIEYDGIPFNKIFGVHEANDKLHAYVTFIAKDYRVPKDGIHIYLSNIKEDEKEENTFYINRESLSSQRLSNFIPNFNINNNKLKEGYITKKEIEENENYNFKELKEKVIDNETLWGRQGKIELKEDTKLTTENSFLEFMNQVDNETIYSNMIVNMLKKYPDLCRNFLKKITKKESNAELNNENIVIEKEVAFTSEEANNKGDGRIDILISSDKHVYVIENKIKSNLNGVKKKDNKISQTQLDKYCAYVTSTYEDKIPHFFIFTPVYNKIPSNLLKVKIDNKEYSYTVITYNFLYNEIFNKVSEEIKKDKYYEEFLKDFSIHSKQQDEYHFDLMMRKFSSAIDKAKPKDK